MKINVTEQTTTFPCPVNKLKGQLMDNKGMQWETEFGDCVITNESIKWIMNNIKESMYNTERCYVYNKALARYFDNNNAFSELNILDNHIKEGITKIKSIGRLQEIKSGKLKNIVKKNKLFVDGSHNPLGAKALTDYLDTIHSNKHIIVGMMSNKEHQEYLNYLQDLNNEK